MNPYAPNFQVPATAVTATPAASDVGLMDEGGGEGEAGPAAAEAAWAGADVSDQNGDGAGGYWDKHGQHHPGYGGEYDPAAYHPDGYDPAYHHQVCVGVLPLRRDTHHVTHRLIATAWLSEMIAERHADSGASEVLPPAATWSGYFALPVLCDCTIEHQQQ